MSLERLKENPIISPCDVKPSRPDFEVIGAFNAGVTRMGEEVSGFFFFQAEDGIRDEGM